MEQQGIQIHGEIDDEEELPDEFQCCVCLDILYKPVVLACGHISCFWCVFRAMDTLQGSHCPVCRSPYNHFPRVCELLHFLLLKLYPQAYKRRERQVAEEEKDHGYESPQFGGDFVDFQFSKVTPLLGAVITKSNPSCEGDDAFVQKSSERTIHEDNTTAMPTTSSSQTTPSEANSVVEHTNKVLVTDLQCAVCKQLLCRPVVLNCGHVHCKACIEPNESVCKCPVCQSPHPRGFPNVCLVLEHFLEEHFPEEYSARKASLPHNQSASSSGSSREKQEQAAKTSSVPTNVYSSLFSPDGAKFHPGVGCDYCGMCPIIGLRYKCKDCVEIIGFDLCEGCYNSSSKLPGRFNQQHTKEHQYDVIEPPNWQNAIFSLEAELSGGSDGIHIVYVSNDASENEVENTISLNPSGDDPHDQENAMEVESPDPSNNHSEDQVDDSAT